MFMCSYTLVPCILVLESMGCRLASAICHLSSDLCSLSSVNRPLAPNFIVRKYLRPCKVFYNCRDTFTNVMSALQIQLFMQNEPKFQKVKLNVNKVLTKDYDQLDTWSIRKNKPKTNPIQTRYEPNSNPIYPVVAPW